MNIVYVIGYNQPDYLHNWAMQMFNLIGYKLVFSF